MELSREENKLLILACSATISFITEAVKADVVDQVERLEALRDQIRESSSSHYSIDRALFINLLDLLERLTEDGNEERKWN